MQAARGASLTPTDHASAAAPDPSASRPIGLLASAALATLALDVATKVWVVERLRGETIELFGGGLLLRQSRNPGAAFGIAGGATVLFTVIAVVVIAVIIRTAPRLRSNGWALALGLILGGASGNLVDRLLRAPGPLRGAVVDFIDLQVWPSFNVADSGIVVGGLVAALLSLRGVEPAGPAADAEAAAEAGDT